ncbi:MAG: hypothetical protein LBP20_06575 [Treponema sp.]|jgi:hypothetical protein|nr:hypothetical protein [Treponema sp.]
MFRVEIIANHSVEENILEAFSREGVGKFYTKYPNVFGVGNSGPRMGDAIWPEENMALVVWCEEDEARGIAHAVEEVKKQFPDEGIRVFGLPGQQNRFSPVCQPDQNTVFVHPEAPPAPRRDSGAAPVQEPAPRSPRSPLKPVPPPVPARAVYTAPAVYTPPDAAGINTEYDGQNMDEEH